MGVTPPKNLDLVSRLRLDGFGHRPKAILKPRPRAQLRQRAQLVEDKDYEGVVRHLTSDQLKNFANLKIVDKRQLLKTNY